MITESTAVKTMQEPDSIIDRLALMYFNPKPCKRHMVGGDMKLETSFNNSGYTSKSLQILLFKVGQEVSLYLKKHPEYTFYIWRGSLKALSHEFMHLHLDVRRIGTTLPSVCELKELALLGCFGCRIICHDAHIEGPGFLMDYEAHCCASKILPG